MVRRERKATDMLTSVKRSCDDDFNIRQKQVSEQRVFPEHQVAVQWFRSGCGFAAGLQTHAAKNGETHRAGDTRDVFSEMTKQIDGNQQKYQPTWLSWHWQNLRPFKYTYWDYVLGHRMSMCFYMNTDANILNKMSANQALYITHAWRLSEA